MPEGQGPRIFVGPDAGFQHLSQQSELGGSETGQDFWQQWHALNVRGVLELQLQRQDELIQRMIHQLEAKEPQVGAQDTGSRCSGSDRAIATSGVSLNFAPNMNFGGFHSRSSQSSRGPSDEENDYVIQTEECEGEADSVPGSGSAMPRVKDGLGIKSVRSYASKGTANRPSRGGKRGGKQQKRTTSLADSPVQQRPDFLEQMLPGNDGFTRNFKCCLQAIVGVFLWLQRLEEPPREGRIARLVLSRKFELACGLVIIGNSVFTISSTNYAMQTLATDSTAIQRGFEQGFCVFYIVELTLKLAVHKCYFYCNEDWRWNSLDTFLVLMAVYDQVMYFLATGGKGANLNFMRSLRVMKITRIFRMIRVIRVFNELRNLLMTIVGSFVSLFWCLVMLSFILLLFGMIFVQVISDHLILEKQEGRLDEEEYGHMKMIFGTVFRAMTTLYMATTGGDDWRNFYDALGSTGSMNQIIFVFYISFFNFAVFNVLTGIFVENAMKVSKEDRDLLIVEQRRKEMFDAESLRRLCHQMDDDGDGTITWKEFEVHLADGSVAMHLAAIGLDVHDAEMFFEMLASISGQDEVDIDDFVQGCMRMKGSATSIDMQMLAYQARLIRKQQVEVADGQKKLESLLIRLCGGGNRYLAFAGMGTRSGLSGTTMGFSSPSHSRSGTNTGMLSRSRSVTKDFQSALEPTSPLPPNVITGRREALSRSRSGTRELRFSDEEPLVEATVHFEEAPEALAAAACSNRPPPTMTQRALPTPPLTPTTLHPPLGIYTSDKEPPGVEVGCAALEPTPTRLTARRRTGPRGGSRSPPTGSPSPTRGSGSSSPKSPSPSKESAFSVRFEASSVGLEPGQRPSSAPGRTYRNATVVPRPLQAPETPTSANGDSVKFI